MAGGGGCQAGGPAGGGAEPTGRDHIWGCMGSSLGDKYEGFITILDCLEEQGAQHEVICRGPGRLNGS